MVRILHNVGSIAAGGMESYIMNIYKNIDRSKVQFDFVVGDDTDYYEDRIKALGGRIFRMPTNLGVFFRFYRFLKQHPEYTTVHSHRDAMSAIYLAAAKMAGIKRRISHSHNTGRKGLAKLVSMILKPFLPFVSTDRFACGKDAGKWLFGKNSYVVKPNSIDCSKFVFDPVVRDEIRKELGIDENTIVIGHIGRLELQKNHAFALKIFSAFLRKYENARFVCAGDGTLANQLVEQSKTQLIEDKCLFLGNRNDVNRLLQAFDIILFPSFYEGFSFAMVEFQAAGLPILCSDVIPPEINLHGRIYFKSLDDSAEDWANSLECILKENQSVRGPESVRIIKEAGYDISDSAKVMQEFYLSTIM